MLSRHVLGLSYIVEYLIQHDSICSLSLCKFKLIKKKERRNLVSFDMELGNIMPIMPCAVVPRGEEKEISF